MTSFLSSENNSPQPCPLPTPESSKSFWHSEPDEFLLGHRTTPELPKGADVVIVGCGITGANAARFLVESGKGLNMVMLEAREVCWGATGRVSLIIFIRRRFFVLVVCGHEADCIRIFLGFDFAESCIIEKRPNGFPRSSPICSPGFCFQTLLHHVFTILQHCLCSRSV